MSFPFWNLDKAKSSQMLAAAGAGIVSLLVLAAILAPTITPHDPLTARAGSILTPPFWQEKGTLSHPLGTDHIGRDVWSRLVYGARTSLIVGLGALAIGGGLGTTLGFISGHWRGPRDRIFDITLPRLIGPVAWLLCCLWVAIVLLASSGAGLINLIIITGLVTWPRYIMAIRRRVMLLETPGLDYTAHGGNAPSDFRSNARLLFPRVAAALPALFISQMGFLTILESILNFLGVGVPPPTPSWGNMIAGTRDQLTNWWVWVPPLLSILLVVAGFYMLGNWLRTRPKNSRAAS